MPKETLTAPGEIVTLGYVHKDPDEEAVFTVQWRHTIEGKLYSVRDFRRPHEEGFLSDEELEDRLLRTVSKIHAAGHLLPPWEHR